jgi:plasmid stability protein
MPDVLIRDVPDGVVAAIDARAAQLGMSCNEYLRRRLSQDAQRSGSPVVVEDLRQFEELFGDLSDPEVMDQAWS